MGALKVVLAGVAASALMMGSAMAADLMAEPPAVVDSASVNWDGFYAGLQGGYDFDGYANVQGVVGVNFTASESFLIGVEGAFGGYFDVGGGGGDGTEGYAAAKVGVVADTALIYGLGGASVVDGNWGWLAGAGVEFSMADNMSLRLQAADYNNDFWQVDAGILFHMN